MSQTASSNYGQLLIARETTMGVIPSTAPTILRITSESIEAEDTNVQSEEIRNDRQVADFIRTGRSVTGDANFEFSRDSFDMLIAAALGNEFPAGEDASVQNGLELHTFTLEKGFTDIDQFIAFTGVGVDSLNLDFSEESIVTGSVSFMGQNAEPMTTATKFTVAPLPVGTSTPFSTSDAQGKVLVDGADGQCLISSLSLNIQTGLRERKALFVAGACEVLNGTLSVSGDISIYLNDANFYNKRLSGEEVPIQFEFYDESGEGYEIFMPRVKLLTGSPNIEGPDENVIIAGTFQALPNRDSLVAPVGLTIRVTRKSLNGNTEPDPEP